MQQQVDSGAAGVRDAAQRIEAWGFASHEHALRDINGNMVGSYRYTAEDAQHTPGPWKTRQADNGVFVLHDADGRHFANLRMVRDMPPEEAAANADVVAAAPELLAALHAIIGDAAAAITRPGQPNGADPALSGIYETARAAIAKAEGR